MDDDTTEISQLLAENTVVARKTEKGTAPKLFYIEADEISLEPVATNRESGYMWSSQERGVGHNVAKDPSPSEKFDNSAARTYDAPDKGVLWGWEVAAYLVTKGIAGGAVLISIVLYWLGKGRQDMVLVSLFVGLVFLAITGALLVKDLDRPDRFLSVLLRPQWRSWIVRGAYIITVFGGLMSAWMLGYYMDWMGSLTVL
ncbi:MAG: polysulfide reductase NrfD, partial [Flavobacteriales bacterium]|nr:polysulfide reductase NrfD [Flavobacteriales bacterium]